MPKMFSCLHLMLEMYMRDAIHGGSPQCSEGCRCDDAEILTYHLLVGEVLGQIWALFRGGNSTS